jgi:hypothetical protein
MRLGKVAVAGAVASGVLAVGVVVAVVSPVSSAFAQTPPATPTPSAKVDRGADYLAKLAANLGVTVDALKAANQKTAGQLIDEAVAAGKLTAEQGTQAKARIASGDKGPGLFGFARPGFGGKGHGGPGGPGGMPGGMPGARGPQSGDSQRGPIGGPNATAAAAIGIDAATLQSELRAGKSLAEIAAAHGKTRDELKAALVGEQSKKLDELIDRKFTPRTPKPGTAPTTTPSAS